jgi:hypothetical protein
MTYYRGSFVPILIILTLPERHKHQPCLVTGINVDNKLNWMSITILQTGKGNRIIVKDKNADAAFIQLPEELEISPCLDMMINRTKLNESVR